MQQAQFRLEKENERLDAQLQQIGAETAANKVPSQPMAVCTSCHGRGCLNWESRSHCCQDVRREKWTDDLIDEVSPFSTR